MASTCQCKCPRIASVQINWRGNVINCEATSQKRSSGVEALQKVLVCSDKLSVETFNSLPKGGESLPEGETSCNLHTLIKWHSIDCSCIKSTCAETLRKEPAVANGKSLSTFRGRGKLLFHLRS